MQPERRQQPRNLKEEEEEKLWEEQDGGEFPEWKYSNRAASMTDAEAQSAPPPAPVEDKLQAERKVIGGLEKVLMVPTCAFISEK